MNIPRKNLSCWLMPVTKQNAGATVLDRLGVLIAGEIVPIATLLALFLKH